MANIERGGERNKQEIIISDEEIQELFKKRRVTIDMYPRNFIGEHQELKVGQKINLSEVGQGKFPIPEKLIPDMGVIITAIEPAKKNSSGHEQISVTFELI